MRKFSIFLACLLTSILLLPAAGAFASATATAAPSPVATPSPSPSPQPTAAPVDNASFEIEVDMGYDGLVIMNHWTPAFVTVTNNGEDFDGTLGVNVFLTLTQYDRYEVPLTIAGGATKRVLLPVMPQVRQDMYAFELTSGEKDEIVAEKRVTTKRLVAPETIAVGLLSETPESLTYFNQRANNLDTLRGEVWMTVPLKVDSFPETSDLLDAFSMLVIDGIDVRTLSEDQQAALSSWLFKGGIVYVSGGAKAATSYPFFSQWTGLSAGKLAEAEDITPALISYIMTQGNALGKSVWLSAMPMAGAIIGTEDAGLVSRHRVGDGLIYTAAFDMSGKDIASWTSMASFWPRVLRQSAPNEYVRMYNTASQSGYNYNENYRARELVDQLRVENNESGVPVIVILVLYLLIVGFGGYFILKKMDRREWLWVAAPVSAIVFALALLLLSRGSMMNKPVTLTASRVGIDGDTAQMNTYIGVATPDGGELTIATDQNQLPTVIRDDGSYWYDDPNLRDKLYRPTDMRQLYRLGSNPAVGFSSNEAWDARMLSLSNMQESVGEFSSRIWMEEDGMHGEIINGTEYTFKHSCVVTAFGYSDIGDILPGQTATFEMLYPKTKIDQSAPNFQFKPNILYSTLDFDLTVQGAYYDNNFYSYLNGAIYGVNDTQQTSEESRQRMALVQLFEDDWQFYQNRSSFYFFGFNDAIGKVSVTLNDTPVTRTAHTAVVGNRITFEPIGPTGQVMFPQGVIPAEIIVDEGEDKPPRLPTDKDGLTNGNNTYGSTDTYLSMSGPAAIRFVLPEWGTYEIEKMTLAGIAYESIPKMNLYNFEEKQWDEQKLMSLSMDGEDWAPYINKDGVIYVRYVPLESANRYESIQMPSLSLKGVVK